MTLNRKTIVFGLLATIVLQLAVLLLEYGGAVYPLVTGQEIRLKVIPVDPRSLFRGNYARLRYEIAGADLDAQTFDGEPRQNEIVYVKLRQEADGIYAADGASLSRPQDGLYIRGRYSQSFSSGTRLRFGIEAFFAPKEKALRLEQDLRNGGVAVVMLASNGKATLKDVIANR